MQNQKTYDDLVICPPAASSQAAISFLNNYDGALAFLQSCPPSRGMQRDMAMALAHDVCSAAKYSRRDMLQALAQRLADGRLIIMDRFANPGTHHNFKRKPKLALQSVPATTSPPPKAPPPAAEPDAPPEIDEAAQAQTLKSAADNGKPFCEICEKAKAERARKEVAG